MDLNPEHRIIILVCSVFLTVSLFKVSANENPEQYVPCKPGWYFFGEKCYKILGLNNKPLNWYKSENSCRVLGGRLATIFSSEFQEFLTAILLLNSKSNAWIGLLGNGLGQSTAWIWIDNSKYNYTNWDNREPSTNNYEFEQYCVEMSYSNFEDGIGKWKVLSCRSSRAYICGVDKNDDTKSPDPRLCSKEDGRGWKYFNSCYHIVKEKKSWEDAEKYCEEKYKGYLVSILDDNVEVFLEYIQGLSKLSKSVWIGIKMQNTSMQKWASGWHVTNKKIDQLSVSFVNGTCALKSNWNSWVIVPCRNKYAFICEKIKYNAPVLQKPPSDEWKCPDSSKKFLDLGGDSCYYIGKKNSRNWLEANYECGRLGGTLASIHSENETNILKHHLLGTQKHLFIGLRRNSTNKDVFEWADGTKVNYQNWDQEAPNNFKNDEMCVELNTADMEWDDIVCNKAKGYICKIKKVFSHSKIKEFSDHVPCNSAFSKDQTYQSGIPVVSAVVIVFCTHLVGLFVGIISIPLSRSLEEMLYKY